MNCKSMQRNKLYSLANHNNYIIYCHNTFRLTYPMVSIEEHAVQWFLNACTFPQCWGQQQLIASVTWAIMEIRKYSSSAFMYTWIYLSFCYSFVDPYQTTLRCHKCYQSNIVSLNLLVNYYVGHSHNSMYIWVKHEVFFVIFSLIPSL